MEFRRVLFRSARLRARSEFDRAQGMTATGPRRARVALLSGCAQQVLAPEINGATVRLLTRHGVEVVVAEGDGCCGALVHHKIGRVACRERMWRYVKIAVVDGTIKKKS